MAGITSYEEAFIPFLGSHHPLSTRETIASGSETRTLLAGTVLATITASGKLKEMTLDATDGSATATHILAEDCLVPATGDQTAVVYTHCEVLERGLVWPKDISAADKAGAIADLRKTGIFVTTSQPA